ncbi:PEP-CTERM sorting domain-containing protein [Coleofasciculus sp. F4-SAH-05]|uniref:PEP-CTERM sorting domain-containing protein n=1 Tax=Coleofasciculus sp. F4-SAH-05 TaxID=3069525 RepID=UPI0032F8CDCF
MATITGDRGNILDVHFTNRSSIDPLRVITVATPVPEPLTILGTGTALGIAPLLKRAYSKKQNKKQKDD